MQTITDTLVERTPSSPLILPGQRTTEKTVGGLLVLLITLVLLPRMVFTVDPGEAGVVWDRFFGTRVDTVYGEGVHVIFPWNRFYKYDVRLQSVTSEYDALAQTGLPIKVSASVRYRLSGAPFKYVVNRGPSTEYSLGELHRRIGPDYRDKVVLPLVGAALRQVIGHYGAEDLYRIQRAAIQDEIVEVIAQRRRKEQFADERTIDVIDVLIRSIALPAPVQLAIEKKMTEEQAMLAYDFTIGREKKEAERKSVEAEGIRRFQEIVTRQGIDVRYLQLRGIEATLELAKSPNAKIVVIGSKDGLPVIVNAADTGMTAPAATTPPK